MHAQFAEEDTEAQTVLSAVGSLDDHVEPDDEADTSQNDQCHGYEVDCGVVLIADQTVRSDNIKTRVTECGY